MEDNVPAYKNNNFIREKMVYCLVQMDEIEIFGLREEDKNNVSFALDLVRMMFEARENKVIRNLITRSRTSFNLFAHQGKKNELAKSIKYLEKVICIFNKETNYN